MLSARVAIAASCIGLAACGSCTKGDPVGQTSASSMASGSAAVVAEALPRCRAQAQRLVIPGEDVVVGDVAIGPQGLLVGLLRAEGGKRVASVLRVSLDLATSSVRDLGAPLGDDPPPSPRWNGDVPFVAFIAGHPNDAGQRLRELRVGRIEEARITSDATIVQQADESTAFDVAWSEGGQGLAAWDEDAPSRADAGSSGLWEGRGFVKVQPFGAPHPRIASPETSDAESPRLLPRPGGGFWLAWLARRVEEEGYSVEGAGEKRAFRWVELTTLNAAGESAGPVRRVSSDKGRAASFELARSGADLVVMVQDEAAPAEGAGARIVRHLVGVSGVQSVDVIDGGVGHAIAELVPVGAPNDVGRWLAWTDTSERMHITPLGAGLLGGRSTAEQSLDGARVLAAASPDGIYALVGASPSDAPAGPGPGPGPSTPLRPELRRFVCPGETADAGPAR